MLGKWAEGYVGVPLIDSGGRCLGSICALTRKPLTNRRLAEALLQIFAIRASSELERKNYEEALAHSEERLRDFVERGKEAIVRVDLEQPIPLDLPEDEKIDLVYRYAYVGDCNDQAARLFGRTNASEFRGTRLEEINPRSDPDQIERLRAGFRADWKDSQIERTFRGRTLLMTRDGIVANGMLHGAWITARDITELKESEAEVRRLNTELKARVQELTELKGRLEQDNAYLLEEIKADHSGNEMVGDSPRFRELLDKIRLVSGTSATVLITGETGTGKELVARAIHNLGPRRDRPMVKVNCAAIPPAWWKRALRHVKGSFTGASETASAVSSTPTAARSSMKSQSCRWRANPIAARLQEHEFEPVGSNQRSR
jgi:transcriptional regulator with PAS, ATPase and Fis domain